MRHRRPNVDPLFINPLPLIGIITGILILRPLKGRGLLILSLDYDRLATCKLPTYNGLEKNGLLHGHS